MDVHGCVAALVGSLCGTARLTFTFSTSEGMMFTGLWATPDLATSYACATQCRYTAQANGV